MPIYEYHCNACGHEFEVMQKINDRPKRKCEKCGRLKAKRMISQTSFILKGSGWYATDYCGKKPTKESDTSSTSKEKEKTSGTDEKSSSKSEKKPKKAESKNASA